MKTTTKTLAVVTLFGLAGVANASIVTFTLSNEVSGSGGELTAPITVTLDDQDTAGTVSITIDMSGLQTEEFMTGLYLNFDPAKDPTGMGLGDTGGVASSGFFTCPPTADVLCKPDGQAF